VQFLAIATPNPERLSSLSPAEWNEVSRLEECHAKDVYLNGTMRHLWLRGDGRGAVAMFEAESLEKMLEIAAAFPLMKDGAYRFEIIPLLPYDGFFR
jgi:muconolactone delta-isomerase